MTNPPVIILDSVWTCRYDDEATGFESSLADLRLDSQRIGTLSCQTTFYLAPTDECVHYDLHIDSVPGVISVYFTGNQPIGGGRTAPLVLDVTEYVALEENTLKLRIDLATVEQVKPLGPVWLEAVPCD